MIARRDTRQTVFVLCRLLDNLHGIANDRVNLRVVLLHVALRQLEEATLRMLHQLVNVACLVEGVGLNVTCKRDELTCQRLLCHDVGMILYVGRRSHA